MPYCSNTPLPILGCFKAQIESHSKITVADVYVIKGKATCLLGLATSTDLNLVNVNITNSSTINNVSECIQAKFPEVFTGIGKLKDTQIALHIDPTVTPVAQTFRRTPFQLRKKIEAKLQELKDNDIIEEATGPTPWISPIVAFPKPKALDELRLCVDMRAANEAIMRERHNTPTIDELIAELNGSKIFSKMDLKAGYHQIEISPESRYITTFATHVGLKRYKRLNFGISSASEIFQNAIRQCLVGIPGVVNISDDILLHAQTQTEHDERLNTLMHRLQDNGLTLNKDKCEFNKRRIEFFGLIFSEDGVSPDPQKVEALKNATPPQTASEISSLLGMAQYSSRFIPNLATITQPLRELTRKGVKFQWTQERDTALSTT